MRRLALLLLTPLLFTASVRAQTPANEAPFSIERYTLPNGLRVWVQPRPDTQSVAATIVFRAGSRYETPATSGISHFVEHMLFTGTERWNEEELKQVISARGGVENGFTTFEETGYFAQVADDEVDVALEWLDQLVFHPTFPAEKVEKERQVIFQEKGGRYGRIINTFDRLGFGYELPREVRRTLFPESKLGRRIIGEDDSLESLTRDDLLAYYRNYYTPENAILVVAGNVEPAQLRSLIERTFGDAERSGRPEPLAEPPLPDGQDHRVVVRGPVALDQKIVMAGARTVGEDHENRWPLEVLAEYLDTMLTEEIRYERGLVYSLSAYNRFYQNAGYFVVITKSKSDNANRILDIIDEHIERVRRGDIDAERLADAKRAFKGRRALGLEDNLSRARWLAGWAMRIDNETPIPSYEENIDAVTPADLSRMITTYFTPQRRFVGIHDPVLTVSSGVRLAAGIMATVAAGVGGAFWVWRRRKRT